MGSPLNQQGFNLDSFRSNIKNVLRSYLFYVSIPQIKSVNGWDADRMTYLVRSSSVPNRAVGALDVNWQGYRYSYGGVSTWDDWSCTFLLDSEMSGFSALRAWEDAIHNPKTNIHGNPEEYAVDIVVQQLHHHSSNRVIGEWTLLHAWPMSVAGYTLDYGSTDSPTTIDVTFRYVYADETFSGDNVSTATNTQGSTTV